MQLSLDAASPVPLYHQLAEALRYRIATGTLAPGTVLPPLRAAARQWGVNLHTVRHAYAALATLGLVRTQAPQGTVVLGGATRRKDGAARPDRGGAEEFFARTLREARERFGLGPAELGRRLARLDEAAGAGQPVHVVECSETQAADLALQLSGRWNVAARGWSLERPGEPPAGPIVATYFHYNDIRTRWPERFPTAHFVAIHPDPALAARLEPRSVRARTTVLVCEREAAMARNIAADLKALLPADRFDVVPRVEARAGATLATAPAGTPVLFAPRVWAALTPAQRADPRAVEIRYLIEPKDLAALGEQLGLAPTSPRHRSTAPARPAVTA
jgi:DNA-binding transcriptional regulator YhcF (GntR family)